MVLNTKSELAERLGLVEFEIGVDLGTVTTEVRSVVLV